MAPAAAGRIQQTRWLATDANANASGGGNGPVRPGLVRRTVPYMQQTLVCPSVVRSVQLDAMYRTLVRVHAPAKAS